MASDGALVSQGRTLPHGAETVTFAGDGSATLRHPLAYVAPDGRKVLQENRTIVIRPPDGRDMVIDFDHDFRVGDAPITLSATPDTAKTPWGGYSGLGLRAARSLTDCEVVNDSGQTGSATNGARAVWVDLSGIADGGPSADRVVGLALIDHPGNPRYPSPSYVYYNSKDFGYINPSLLRHEAMTLDAGQALRLAYRAVAHDGAADANRLRVLADQFGATRHFDE